MRILIYCYADLNVGSGSEVRARLIVEGLVHWQHTICVVSAGVPASWLKQGVKYISSSGPEKLDQILKSAAAEFKPDWMFGVTEGQASTLVDVAYGEKISVGFDAHGLGFVEAIELGRRYGNVLLRCYMSLRWLRSFRKAGVVTSANPTLTWWLAAFSARVVPLIGISDTEHFSPTGPIERLGVGSNRIHVLYAGNFFPWQGFSLLSKSVLMLGSKDHNFAFSIVGSINTESEEFRLQKASLAECPVRFHSSISYEEMPSVLRGADILIVPRPFMLSTYLAFPQKICDYMASGRTVLVTDLKSHRWAIKHGETGLVAARTPNGIVEALRSAQDEKLRVKLGENARAFAVKHFCYIRQTQRLADLLIAAG